MEVSAYFRRLGPVNIEIYGFRWFLPWYVPRRSGVDVFKILDFLEPGIHPVPENDPRWDLKKTTTHIGRFGIGEIQSPNDFPTNVTEMWWTQERGETNHFSKITIHQRFLYLYSCWLNQPLWRICKSQIGSWNPKDRGECEQPIFETTTPLMVKLDPYLEDHPS